ncbi:DUF2497 domain-containing protein [Rhodospirillaceae bacterium RKSG073]|nr:DUF2497 domain-containing protein [Curvivirga aplysinae]
MEMEPEPEPEPEPLELMEEYEEYEEEEPLELMEEYEEEPLVLEDERIISNYTEEVGVASLAHLENSIRMGHSGETLEEIVKGLLRPMLKVWLDENLPEMVERMVQREIDRMASGARRVSDRDDY